MQQKGLPGHARDLVAAGVGEAPEGLVAVNGEAPWTNPSGPWRTRKRRSKPTSTRPPYPRQPAVLVGTGTSIAADNGLQGLFRTVRDAFGVHLPAVCEQAKADGFAARPPAALAPA